MPNYYSKSLNSNKLKECYAIAPPRTKQFLEAEINYVLSEINEKDTVLDLGCGYGRVAVRLAEKAEKVTGIDISPDNIEMAKEYSVKYKNCEFYTMNALNLSFPDQIFDMVVCVQNGISAFHVDPLKLIKESIRVTRKGGIVLFSTYSDKFWNHRLEWFRKQADLGLIGEIDEDRTSEGIIICKDGFKAVTYSKQELLFLASNFNLEATVYEIDNSCVFCKILVN